MRASFAFLFVVLAFAATAFAWSKEDYEIFDLVSALETAEGKGVDFYNHIGVEPSASTSEITKAYRKKSLALHPDKNPGVKNIQERFARLGVIAQILRSPEGRERYNFFHKNGVPRWRGTGYYYSRYRPTLSHTLMFLVLLTSGLHYLVLNLNYRKHQRRIEYFINSARSQAGVLSASGSSINVNGLAGAGGARRRKVRVAMVEGNEGAGTLELIVSGDQVLLPHDDGSLEPLTGLAQSPHVTQTWFLSLLFLSLSKTISHLPPSVQASLPPSLRFDLPQSASTNGAKNNGVNGEDEDDDDDDDGESSAIDTPTPAPRSRAQMAKNRTGKGSRSNTGTPRESELDSDAVVDDGGLGGGEGKKKKAGAGKAAAMRKRKMALKK
ncbi:hypothetical protein CI109_105601 [Kwoniella shandongensis]|uniref:Uncharacterized protein n=1 Tax=Kwoniella shandongensis TaxID=1734106 RepID=A0A5M6C7J3_9TREE|nr:uncharacterized protein CI109_002318 [Kwoniella shandongensis]KAA5529425.1 hypothetical protein CI109_002318 [Kwoniella shandongensis]